jgi:hypothetical protein
MKPIVLSTNWYHLPSSLALQTGYIGSNRVFKVKINSRLSQGLAWLGFYSIVSFSTTSQVFFHRATNPYAEIYFDQQNSNAALQLVVVRAM